MHFFLPINSNLNIHVRFISLPKLIFWKPFLYSLSNKNTTSIFVSCLFMNLWRRNYQTLAYFFRKSHKIMIKMHFLSYHHSSFDDDPIHFTIHFVHLVSERHLFIYELKKKSIYVTLCTHTHASYWWNLSITHRYVF